MTEKLSPTELYEKNEALVYYIVNQRYPDFISDEDLLQEAKIGLWKACLSYNPDRSMLSTFAVPAICNSINIYLRKCNRDQAGIACHLEDEISGEENSYIMDYIVGDPGIDWIDAEELLSHLDASEQFIVKQRILGYSLEQIASILKITRQGVSLRIKRIQKKLHKYMRKDELNHDQP